MSDLSWIKPAMVVVAWAGALLCCFYIVWLDQRASGQRRRLQAFYSGQTVLLLLLGMNRQWDLLNALTSYSRLMAMREGWYNTRRLAQFDLIVGLGVVALLLLLLTAWGFRTILRDHWLPLVAAIGLLTYIGVRTVSLHAVDAIIQDRMLGVPLDWIIELVGVCLLISALTVAYRQQVKYHRESFDSR